MVVATQMLFVHVIPIQTKLDAFADQVSQMLVQIRPSSAEVLRTNRSNLRRVPNYCAKFVSDSCQVNNGGCGSRANCTRNPTTNVIRCICRAGFVNTGSDSSVVCTGNRPLPDRVLPSSEFYHCIL